MISPQPWATMLFVLLGNCGFWLYGSNRIGSTGLPWRWIKRIKLLIIVLCLAIPGFVLIAEWQLISVWLYRSSQWWPSNSSFFSVWAICSLISLVVLGLPWLESRRWIFPPKQLLSSHSDRFDVSANISGRSAVDPLTRFLVRLPGNQTVDLEVNRKELQLARYLPGIDGLKIGHLSDLHFTGRLSLEHYHFVLDRFLELQPDLIVITGDIIDYAKCLPWIEPLLGRLRAPLGCAYVLGNHDRRLKNLDELTSMINSLGHFDLGAADQRISLRSGATIHLTGNELPWFARRVESSCWEALGSGELELPEDELRLGLSHSPDQIDGARRLRLDLLLAGHTHGGQIRFPLIGPVVAPSRYGSRFASGVFYRHPTLMHVSRGIAGTHPLRWRCRPEISLLILRSKGEDESLST